MKIGLITYQVGHKKTLDVALRLLAQGRTCTLYAFPFVKREPKPSARYRDRPSQIMDFDVEDFCARYGLGYKKMNGWGDEHAPELSGENVWLHCTAKIVPPAFLKGRFIVNAHPGLLPVNRGVDAFKWAIVKGWSIGVTLHYIDEQIDRGVILQRVKVPILSDDTLTTVWWRAYELECDMLANFPNLSGNCVLAEPVGDDYPVSHDHIPQEFDDMLPELFLRKREILMSL